MSETKFSTNHQTQPKSRTFKVPERYGTWLWRLFSIWIFVEFCLEVAIRWFGLTQPPRDLNSMNTIMVYSFALFVTGFSELRWRIANLETHLADSESFRHP